MQRRKLTNSELRRKLQSIKDTNGFMLGTLAQVYTGHIEPEDIRDNLVSAIELNFTGMEEVISNLDFLVRCIENGEEGMEELRQAVIQENRQPRQ